MRKSTFSIIFILIVSSVSMPLFLSLISTPIGSDRKQSPASKLNTSALTEINTTLVINDLPGSPINWTWAKAQGYCTGSGTLLNPYVISEIYFNAPTISTNQLAIMNSRKHFVIKDCEFKGHSSWAGIWLYNTTNGVISKNWMHAFTGALVWLFNSSYNVVQNNNASRGSFYGIIVESTMGITKNNLISNNVIAYNLDSGIYFLGGATIFNTISDNNFYNNTIGINIDAFSDNNTVRGNRITNSSILGVFISTLCGDNRFYENCFFTNTEDANDNGFDNTWDNGARGNYWDAYNGTDANGDGIGDVPYNITGIAGSQDRFPLMSCLPTPSGIPGYDVFLVLFGSMGFIIGIIFIINKKKSNF